MLKTILGFSLLLGVPLRAATVIDVGPASGSVALGANEALVASFTLSSALNQVQMTADILCVSCSATLYLTRNALGPATGVGDLWFAAPVSGNLLFSGQDLPAGDYYAVLANASGTLLWSTAGAPVIVEAPGATHEIDYVHNVFDSVFPPASNFQALLPDVLVYTVSTQAVPEASSGMLFGGAVAALALLRRLRRASAQRE